MDTYELAGRHDFFPSSSPSPSNENKTKSPQPRQPPRLLLAGRGFIDVELPASHSAQHAVGLEFELLPQGGGALEVGFPLLFL